MDKNTAASTTALSTTTSLVTTLSPTAPLATPTLSHTAPLTAPSPLPITQGSTPYLVTPELSKSMKPPRLEILPNAPDAIRIFKHWMFIFKGLVGSSAQNKFVLLANCVSHEVFELIQGCTSYETAIAKLESSYIKPKSEIISRFNLQNLKQTQDEKISDYLLKLEALSLHCGFRDVTAEIYRKEMIRDAFITGLKSNAIRTRLLENSSLSLDEAAAQARALEVAQFDSTQYAANSYSGNTLAAAAYPGSNQGQFVATNHSGNTHQLATPYLEAPTYTVDNTLAAAAYTGPNKGPRQWVCFKCGSKEKHSRERCTARDAVCRGCQKIGHFQKVCHSKPKTLAAVGQRGSRSTVEAAINNTPCRALLDTGSEENFLDEQFAKENFINILPFSSFIMLAQGNGQQCYGVARISISFLGRVYENVRVIIMKNLIADVILGDPWFKIHKEVTFKCGGEQAALTVSSLKSMTIKPPRLFPYINKDVRPIATKSRKYSEEDKQFISSEIEALLKNGIIEPSNSPWRAQVLVVKSPKKRLVIDFSCTINRYTPHPDAYPLPVISDLVNNLAKYRYFSRLDLKSAYHQIPLLESEKQFTGFEADGRLYQFTRLCFGLTNAVAAFQRVMNELISAHKLKGTYVYVDDVIIGGVSRAEHDENLEAFMKMVRNYQITLNETKCLFNQDIIRVLGYEISQGVLKPDPSRTEALLRLEVPSSAKALQRLMGFFSYYACWVPDFSMKVRPLVGATFPLSSEAVTAIHHLKNAITTAAKAPVDENAPFCVETDASDTAISGILSQRGRPVAFFSRSLHPSEKNHHIVEKEAYAIVESIRKWHHFLAPRAFTLVTDQKSVKFMFDKKHSSKIKNEKILRWKLELMPYSYDIVYRSGPENTAADMLSRPACASLTDLTSLKKLHEALCHPGHSGPRSPSYGNRGIFPDLIIAER